MISSDPIRADSTSPMTIAFWSKASDAWNGDQGMIGVGNMAGGGQFVMALWDGGDPIQWMYLRTGDVDGDKYITATNVTTWRHNVVVYTGSEADWYVNGELAFTGAEDNVGATPIMIGNSRACGDNNCSYQFHGMIDDVMVFDRALPIEDAQKLYRSY